jgi:Protein of unknown function (DUF3435)
MHEDYQLAYCPLAYITSLAFADDAFENTRLTPELLHKLRVPGRLHVLPLRFKKSMLNTPIFRGTVKPGQDFKNARSQQRVAPN